MNLRGPEDPTLPDGKPVASRPLGEDHPASKPTLVSEPAFDDDGASTLLGAVIEAEVLVIERGLAVVGLFASTVGLVVALTVALTTDLPMGWPLVGVALVCEGYFLLLRRLLRRAVAPKGLFWITPVVEQLVVFLITLVIVGTQGAAYALGSWVPPILAMAFLVVNVPRLRPVVSLTMGGLAAGLFATVAFVAIPILDPLPLPNTELYTVRTQLTRCFTLITTGLMCAAASVALRRVLGHGARRMRSQELFGKYRLGGLIAVGGMGRVLQATYCPEGGFERKVAIKQIHDHLAQDTRFVDAFRTEAELCARLNHPNIVQVLDFGRAQGSYFFAMEHVDGANLGQLVAKARAADRPLPPSVVAWIAREVGEALYFAHVMARGPDGEALRVIHRDLSPRNILLSRTGQVKLTDFGIARALRDAGSHQTQHMMGSLAYFAPEQVQEKSLDERTDLFAFGVVIFELLTLQPLFQRSTDAATLLAVIDGEIPDVRTLRPELDPAWSELLERALKRDPDQRFQAAADMNAALEERLKVEGVPGAHELRDWVETMLALPSPGTPEEMATVVDRPGERSRTQDGENAPSG
jgi:serine/threonine-protein kinase